MSIHHGERIASIRTALGLSQADLAVLLDVSWETVRSWEGGRRAYQPGVWEDLLGLLAQHQEQITDRTQQFQSRSDLPPVLLIEKGAGTWPVGWQRTVAAAVLAEVPELVIVRGDTEGAA